MARGGGHSLPQPLALPRADGRVGALKGASPPATLPGMANIRVGSVALDCADPVALGAFWAELLGGEVGSTRSRLAKEREAAEGTGAGAEPSGDAPPAGGDAMETD